MDYKEASSLLKLISNPTRLRILEKLKDGVKCVTDLEEFLELRQPNISQHLSVLRHSGVVDFFVDGKMRCYFLKEPRVLDVLRMLNKRCTTRLPAPSCCPSKAAKEKHAPAVAKKRQSAKKNG